MTAGAGRPTKLTPTRHKAIMAAIEQGATYEHAAAAAGISYDTLNEWRKHNPVFSEALKQAEGRGARLLAANRAGGRERAMASGSVDPGAPVSRAVRPQRQAAGATRGGRSPWRCQQLVAPSWTRSETIPRHGWPSQLRWNGSTPRKAAGMATVAHDWALALDPVRFSRAAGIEPDPWQADVLRSSAPRILLNCCRQSGKSTTVGTLAAHTAVYQPGSLVLLVSPTQRQSAELLLKVRTVLGTIGPVEMETESVLALALGNGSRVVSLPGHNEGTIRGYSCVDLLLVDEASRVRDDLMAAVRPARAVSGDRLVALSTPFGTRGWWFEAWRGTEAWQRHKVQAVECPRIPADFLAEERRELGEWYYAQEYECAFQDSQSAAFRQVDIDAAFQEGIETWDL
jgi:hypothetical protein